MDTWRTASTRTSSTEATWTRTGQVICTPHRTPEGTLHAYRAGDERTACGQPLATLKRWPARRFGRGALARRRCRRCLDLLRTEAG